MQPKHVLGVFYCTQKEWKANHVISVIKLGSNTDWYLILILIVEYTRLLQKQMICHHPHCKWWHTVKHKLAGKKFKKLTFSTVFLLSVCQMSAMLIVDIWKVGKLSICLTVCLSCLAGWLWQENIFSSSTVEFKLQKLLFSDFLHYNLQLSLVFRLCNIIIVSECQTGKLKTVMMR